MAYVHSPEEAMPYEVPAATRDFMAWAVREGAVFPKLRYPVRFVPGYIGAQASADLSPNEVLIRVPSKMWISSDKANSSPLRPIFDSNPEVFGEDETSTSRIVAFMAYELSKGDSSYWHPFFQFLEGDIDTLTNWTEEECRELQDQEFAAEVRIMQSRIERALIESNWLKWRDALRTQPELMKEEQLTFKRFHWLHNIIRTRSFGKYLDGNFVIPLADLINHDSKSLTCYMIGAPDFIMHSFPLEDDYDYEPEEDTHPRPPGWKALSQLHFDGEEGNGLKQRVESLPVEEKPPGTKPYRVGIRYNQSSS